MPTYKLVGPNATTIWMEFVKIVMYQLIVQHHGMSRVLYDPQNLGSTTDKCVIGRKKK